MRPIVVKESNIVKLLAASGAFNFNDLALIGEIFISVVNVDPAAVLAPPNNFAFEASGELANNVAIDVASGDWFVVFDILVIHYLASRDCIASMWLLYYQNHSTSSGILGNVGDFRVDLSRTHKRPATVAERNGEPRRHCCERGSVLCVDCARALRRMI